MFTIVFKVCLENLTHYFSKLMYVKYNDILGMNSYICMFFQIPAQILDLHGAKDILSSQFSCEKRIFCAPIQTILDGMTTNYYYMCFFLSFFLSVHHTLSYYTNNAQLTVKYHTL
jgi:hypothetical protein